MGLFKDDNWKTTIPFIIVVIIIFFSLRNYENDRDWCKEKCQNLEYNDFVILPPHKEKYTHREIPGSCTCIGKILDNGKIDKTIQEKFQYH